MEAKIELNKELVNYPAAILAIVVEDSMKDCGIGDEALLVIDKSFEPQEESLWPMLMYRLE